MMQPLPIFTYLSSRIHKFKLMKHINTCLLCIAAMLASLASFGQNYTWTQEPSLSHTLYAPSSFTIGNDIYVVSGLDHFGPGVTYPATMSHEVWDFNTVSRTWTQKNNFPGTAIYAGRGFAIGSYGYIVNGWDSTGSGRGPSTLWQYDPSNDSWTQKAAFPGSTRYTTATFAVSGKGYVACGFSPYNNEVYSYDPVADSWSQKSNFPGAARQDMSYFVIGNYAYAGMGSTSDGRGSYFLESDWYKYDPSTDVWTRLNDFPGNALSGTSYFSLNGEGYVINGLDQNSVYFNTTVSSSNKVWKYAPASDSWSLWGVFPDTATFDGTSVYANGAGYCGFGGKNFSTLPLSRSFYRFGPGTGSYSCNITFNKYQISNAVYNFQANGSFSPTAVISWTFGDGGTGTGTSVIHSYTAVGTYNVVVSINDTASSCNNSFTDSVSIANINNCSATINHINYDTLFTLSTVVTNGAGPYTYQWSCSSDSTFSNTTPDPFVSVPHNTPTTYCVTVTDTTGCAATACTTVVDSQVYYTPCQIYLAIYPDSTMPGWYYGVLYTSGATNLTYLWDFGDGTTSNLLYPTHTYASPGRYTICLTVSDSSGCSYTFCDSSFYAYKYGGGPMDHFQVGKVIALGVENISTANGVAVYPNPTSKELSIDASGQKIDRATIYDIHGQIVIDASSPAQNKVDVSSIAPGIYFIEVQSMGSSTRVKFAKINN